MIGSSLRSTCRKMEHKLAKRGTVDVVNRFGGNCFSCHVQAAAQWDLVCETGHGCAPLPVTPAMIRALQRTDPRCGDQPISPEDAEAIKQLEQLLKHRGEMRPKANDISGLAQGRG